MELFGLIFAVPVTLLASIVYCCGAAFILARRRGLRRPALIGSLVVLFCILAEVALVFTWGAETAYARLYIGFTAIHETSFFLGPPAIANLLLLAMFARSNARKIPKIAVTTLICWVVCMAALLGNIAVDEAIVGPDAGKPYYMTRPR